MNFHAQLIRIAPYTNRELYLRKIIRVLTTIYPYNHLTRGLIYFAGPSYEGHVAFLAPTVKELCTLEKRAQTSYITLLHQKPFLSRW